MPPAIDGKTSALFIYLLRSLLVLLFYRFPKQVPCVHYILQESKKTIITFFLNTSFVNVVVNNILTGSTCSFLGQCFMLINFRRNQQKFTRPVLIR